MSRRPPAVPRAALTAALLVAAVLVLAACGADVERPATGTTATTTATATATLAARPQGDGDADTGGTAAPATRRARGPLAFHVTRRAQLRRAPGGKVITAIATRTEFKSPTILAIAARRPGWVLVRTTLAKQHVGWLPASAGAVFEEPRSIVIDLSARTLTLFHRGRMNDR
jgi:hypothetical protein